jgi:uncharacterized protein with WD repeat
MPMSRAEAAAYARRIRQETATPEQRRAQTAAARRASAVKVVVEQWPELRPEQIQKLRSLLRPVPEGGGSDA